MLCCVRLCWVVLCHVVSCVVLCVVLSVMLCLLLYVTDALVVNTLYLSIQMNQTVLANGSLLH